VTPHEGRWITTLGTTISVEEGERLPPPKEGTEELESDA
jgi:hypothetical protein